MADTQLIARQLLSDLKRDFGLTNEQAAGVVGNLMHESGGFNSLQEINPTVPGSAGGFGFAQWTGDRRKSFDNYVENQGLDRNSYQANYGFLKHELENDPYERRQFNTVKKAETAAEAAKLVSENYLRPGIPHNASRVRYAEQILPYADMPVPPGEIPNTVGTLTDTVPPAPPVPVSPMPSTAAMRGMTSPTGGNTDLQTALDQYATRERNRVIPQMPPVKSVQTIASIPTTPSRAFNGDPLTPARGDVVASIPTRAPSQSYAGQDTARPRFNGDPLTPARGTVVASIPTRPPVSRAPISYAGQEASPPRQALPTQDRTRTASLEPSSRIGMPPATRSVQSIPVPMQNALAAARAEQGIQRSVAPSMPRQFAPPSIPGPAPVAKTNDRLLASTGIDFVPAPSVRQPAQSGGLSRDAMERQRSYAQAQLTPGIPQPPTVRLPTLAAPMSLPTLEELTGATGFRVPMPAMPAAPRIAAPVPFPRPAFAAPRVAQAPVRRVAPVPMPLAARPVQRAPLSILVQGSNTIRPQQSLYYRDPRAFGNAATSQSGDTSVGSQADAAAARASGDSYRASRR